MKNTNLNSRKNSWAKALFTFFVVAIPSLMIWFFLSKDFGGKENVLSFGFGFLIAFAFIISIFFLSYLFFYLKITDIYLFAFSLPVAISFMGIYLSSYIPYQENYILYRALIVIPLTLIAIPINIIVTKINLKLSIKEKRRY